MVQEDEYCNPNVARAIEGLFPQCFLISGGYKKSLTFAGPLIPYSNLCIPFAECSSSIYMGLP
jgi:hypothetical protein